MTLPPLINKRVRKQIVPGSDSTVDRMEARGEFPKRLRLTPGSRAVFWRRAEIEQWLRDRGVEMPADFGDRPDEAAAAGRRRRSA